MGRAVPPTRGPFSSPTPAATHGTARLLNAPNAPEPPPRQVCQQAAWRSDNALRPLQSLRLKERLEGVPLEQMDVALAREIAGDIGADAVVVGGQGEGGRGNRGGERGCPPP